ncbi:MAG: tetratricopeptide repeat protein [Cyanobacteria bacterium SZAS LIN-3]|nr:tetratricopeptide repeat protein [Cyanobacteria bacterium SZAS LIN-3]
MALSRNSWFSTRTQTAAILLSSAFFLAPWIIINSSVEGHAKFQPLGTILGLTGMRAYQQGHTDFAESLLSNALKCHIGDTSDDAGYAYFSHWLGNIEYCKGKNETALHLEEQSTAAYEKALGPNSYLALLSHAAVASNLAILGRYPLAETSAKEVLALGKNLPGEKGQLLIACTKHILADVYIDLGHLEEAEPLAQDALAVEAKTLGPQSGWRLEAQHILANITYKRGNLSEAEKLYSALLKTEEKYRGSHDPWTVGTRVKLAIIREKLGLHDQSLDKICADVVASTNRKVEQERGNFCGFARTVGNLCLEQGKYADAERLFKISLARAKHDHGPDSPCTLMTMHNLGELYLKQGRFAEAHSIVSETMNKRALICGTDSADTRASFALHDEILAQMNAQAVTY